jgi:hypothetical protein
MNLCSLRLEVEKNTTYRVGVSIDGYESATEKELADYAWFSSWRPPMECTFVVPKS